VDGAGFDGSAGAVPDPAASERGTDRGAPVPGEEPDDLLAARRDLAHAALDDLLDHADDLSRLRLGAAVGADLARTAPPSDDGRVLRSLALRATDAATRQEAALRALEQAFTALVEALTTDGVGGDDDVIHRAEDGFATARQEARERREETTVVLRAAGRLAAGTGATATEAGEAVAVLWDLGLELLALTALAEPADDPDDDDSGRLSPGDGWRLLRDLAGLLSEVAVNAPAALALRADAASGPVEVTVRHHHDEVVVTLDGSHEDAVVPPLRHEDGVLVARLAADEAPPDVAALVAEVLHQVGAGPDLTYLVVRLPDEATARRPLAAR
jgi:hypothetical protein